MPPQNDHVDALNDAQHNVSGLAIRRTMLKPIGRAARSLAHLEEVTKIIIAIYLSVKFFRCLNDQRHIQRGRLLLHQVPGCAYLSR